MAMEVVLKQDVEKLGLRGEVVNVARGYARNFLLPRGLAEVATPGLVRELEKRQAQHARHEAKSSDEARAIADRLERNELGAQAQVDAVAAPGLGDDQRTNDGRGAAAGDVQATGTRVGGGDTGDASGSADRQGGQSHPV